VPVSAAPSWVLRQELGHGGVIVSAAVLLAGAAWVSVHLGGTLGGFFGLCFVLVCLTGALAASDRAMFTAGVLPPLAMVSVVLLVSVMAPEAVASDSFASNPLTRAVAGIIDLAAALVLGHLLPMLIHRPRPRSPQRAD